MRPNSMRWWRGQGGMWAALALASVAIVTPAAAQLQGDLRYVSGSTLVPDPPLAGSPTTLVLYGDYPTGCGEIQDTSVTDTGHVSIRLHATACVDTSHARWVGTFALGRLAAGSHTVEILLTMDQPDSGVTVHRGWVTFDVAGEAAPPAPPAPSPPPAPQPPPAPAEPSLLQWTSTDPWPPTPDRPMALLLGGHAPFGCPVVTDAAAVDS